MNTIKTINESWSTYDRTVARSQLANFGIIFLDSYGIPIDDEYDLEALFAEFLKNEKR